MLTALSWLESAISAVVFGDTVEEMFVLKNEQGVA